MYAPNYLYEKLASLNAAYSDDFTENYENEMEETIFGGDLNLEECPGCLTPTGIPGLCIECTEKSVIALMNLKGSL